MGRYQFLVKLHGFAICRHRAVVLGQGPVRLSERGVSAAEAIPQVPGPVCPRQARVQQLKSLLAPDEPLLRRFLPLLTALPSAVYRSAMARTSANSAASRTSSSSRSLAPLR